MAVGQLPTKQTWLLDEVEVRGIVRLGDLPTGAEVGSGDVFDLVPDPDYLHLVSLMPASKGAIHCETYPLPAEQVNHDQSWPLPQKPEDAQFEARDPLTGTRRPLVVGDHIRVVGRWTIDHHPEECITRTRGLLRVGCVWPELHPFRWDDITLVIALPPSGVEEVTLSLAAPLHEEAYLGSWKWAANELAGVAGRVFVADDKSNYHDSVSAEIHVAAPALPTGWTAVRSLLAVDEAVTHNGTDETIDSVRVMTIRDDGLDVTATLTAPPEIMLEGGLRVGDLDGPAKGKSVFQARYRLEWRSRLAAAPVFAQVGAGEADAAFEVRMENLGPDPVTLRSMSTQGGDAAAFVVDWPEQPTVPGGSTAVLRGRFSPPRNGRFSTQIVVASDDPCGRALTVPLSGMTAGMSGRLRVAVRPETVPLGRPGEIAVITEDSGGRVPVPGTASILNYSLDGQPAPFTTPTNEPIGVTLRTARTFDPELHQWIPGELPSGVVKVPGYEEDVPSTIPFKFDTSAVPAVIDKDGDPALKLSTGLSVARTRWTVALVCIPLAMLVAAWFLQPVYAFLADAVLLLLFIVVCGRQIVGLWRGALVDERNKVSLSRFQTALWTTLIIAAFLAAALHNIREHSSDPLKIDVPPQLWILLGISVTSLVGAGLIKQDKAQSTPDLDGARQALSGPSGVAPENIYKTDGQLRVQGEPRAAQDRILARGVLTVNDEPSQSSWLDMFRAEEIGGVGRLDLGKIQMFYFTLVIIFAYGAAIVSSFRSSETLEISALPAVGESTIALLAISHAAYLTNKAVPHTNST